MSIAMESNNSSRDRPIERPGFIFSICDDDDRRSEEDYRSSSSSTSSIGKNSDESNSNGEKRECEEEVESEYKGGPLDALEELEEALPVKKSISKFYNGKSKSFTSLSDAVSCSSVKEITKPDNPYSKKRKNLLAFNNIWNNNPNNFSRSRNGGLSKRASNSRSMVALATSADSSESNSFKNSNSNLMQPGPCLPPLPPHAKIGAHGLSSYPPADKFSSWRSFSLADLQGAEAATPSNNGCFLGCSDEERNISYKTGAWVLSISPTNRKTPSLQSLSKISKPMDSSRSATPPNKPNPVPRIERSLYLLLQTNLFRDSCESLYVVGLWMWLNGVFPNLTCKIFSLPPFIIYELADEALACLRGINADFPYSSDLFDIPLTCSLINRDLTLLFFHQNCPTAFGEIRDLVNGVLVPSVSDVIEQPPCGGFSPYSTTLPIPIPGHASSSSHMDDDGEDPFSVNDLADNFFHMNMRSSSVNPRDKGPASEVAPADRTMFVTFSNGYPLIEADLTSFFRKIFGGSTIESIHMHRQGGLFEQPIYARILFYQSFFIDAVLNGQTKARFTINGKYVWLRKFIQRDNSPTVCECPSRDACVCVR